MTSNPLADESRILLARDLFHEGQRYLQQNNLHSALFHFSKARILDPGMADAILCQAHCHHLRNEYAQALDCYEHLLSSAPDSAAGWNNRGVTLLAMGRYDEAVEAFTRSLALFPGNMDAKVARASCFQSMGMRDEALSECDAVLSAAPDNAEAHWNRGLLLLLTGNYAEGWKEYEWRWKKRDFTSPLRHFDQPTWGGERCPGKTILVHAEQGFGDTIQFCRYLPFLTDMTGKVIFECHPELLRLMQSLHPDIQLIARDSIPPPFDVQVPLLSLPGLFTNDEKSIPVSVPYLFSAPQKSESWASHFRAESSALKIGLCWEGKSYPDPARSCPRNELVPLETLEGVAWYSLQYGKSDLPFPMNNVISQVEDFSDTAAIISHLDLVITIDTAVAHLAGALGKEVWLLLPYAPDWRWLLNRTDSPWYPTMKLLRQTVRNRWDDVIAFLGSEIATRISENTHRH